MQRPGLRMRIEATLSSLSRDEISRAVKHSGDDVQIEYCGDPPAEYLEVGTAAAVAAVVVGLAQVAISLLALPPRQTWSLERVTGEVRRAAAETLGSDELTGIRFEGLHEFLENEVDCCRVTAEINDEWYSFVLFHDAEVLVLKQE